MIDFVMHTWPIWAGLAIIILGWWLYRDLKQEYYLRLVRQTDLSHIDRMNGSQFEAFLERLFKSMGYRAHNIHDRGDYGADLLVLFDGKRTVVQAKRYSDSVGLGAVQEAVAAVAYYDCEAAMVVTNNYFTDSARRLAEANDVVLWDRDDLTGILADLRARGQVETGAQRLLLP